MLTRPRIPDRRNGLLLTALAGLLLAASALADGFIVGYDPAMDRWSLQQEESQVCFINHRDGIQRMLLSVGISDLRSTRSAWVVPIPARPESTTLDIQLGMPGLHWSDDVLEDAWEKTSSGFWLITFPLVPPHLSALLAQYIVGPDRGGVAGNYRTSDVTAHTRVAKHGLTAELVTWDEPGALLEYLREHGAELPPEASGILDEYAADSFCFAVTWISDSSAFFHEFLDRQLRHDAVAALSLSLEFPAERAWFPVRPTSVYGDQVVPVVLYVVGHVTPVLPGRLSRTTDVSWKDRPDFRVAPEFRRFFGSKGYIRQLEFTRVELNAPSHLLTEDLWFEHVVPARVSYARFISRCPMLAWMLPVFILLSCLSSLLAGLLALGRYRLPAWQQLLFGLYSLLSVVVFVVAAAITRFPERSPRPALLADPGPSHVNPGRRMAFIVVYLVLFGLFLLAFRALTLAPLA